LRKNRKLLLLLLLLAIVGNAFFFYIKSRPKLAVLYLDISVWLTDGEMSRRTASAITLNSDGTWHSAEQKSVNPLEMLLFAIPNTDSAYYQAVVATKYLPTFGDAIQIGRSLAKRGICNFSFLHAVENEGLGAKVYPIIISAYRQSDQDKLVRCQTANIIAVKYESALLEYNRIRKLQQANNVR
jgi:hypothetical protein